MVTRIDDCVGDLLQTLRDLEIDEETLVIFTSDNGPHSEHYLSGGSYNASAFESYGELEGEKRDCHEGGIRVPTLVWGPGRVMAGEEDPTPSQFHDWLATLADYAGLVPPAQTDGVSLRPLLSGTGDQRQGTVYVEYSVGGSTPGYFPNHGGTSRNQAQVIYRDGYKGIRNNVSSHATPFRIYDTLLDPDESEDLTALPSSDPRHSQFQALAEEMRAAVLRVRQPNASAPRPYDNAEVAPLAPPAVQPGIDVRQYEGVWPWVPDFEMLTEVGSQVATQVGPSPLSRSADAGLSFTGLIEVPTGGLWTFYLESDRGAVLHIHDSLVIDGDAILFTPPAGTFSVHRFSYTITDGAEQDSATVTVTITPASTTGSLVAHYTFDGATGLEDLVGLRPGQLATNATIQNSIVRTGSAALRVDGTGGDELSDNGFRTSGPDFNFGTGARTVAFFVRSDDPQPGGDLGTISMMWRPTWAIRASAYRPTGAATPTTPMAMASRMPLRLGSGPIPVSRIPGLRSSPSTKTERRSLIRAMKAPFRISRSTTNGRRTLSLGISPTAAMGLRVARRCC
jgi:hypothetical protein